MSNIDNYITKEPDSSFDEWIEAVADNYAQPCLDDDIFFESELELKWMQKLFKRTPQPDVDEKNNYIITGNMSPETAAKIICRAYNIYYDKIWGFA